MSHADTENPRQNVTFDSATESGHAHGYLRVPESGSGPGVIVIQEWWGLTDHVVDVVDRFAAEGFVALAPDLYGGRTTHDAAEAKELLVSLPVDRAAHDLAGAVTYLLQRPEVTSATVGAVGFCMGGAFVLRLAAQQGDRIGAAVPWYGLPALDTDYSGVRAAVLGHYGEQDGSVPLDDVRATAERIREQAGVEVTLHEYPAPHAFYNDERPSYRRESAELAWERTTAFLRERLTPADRA
ncbi:dienelactone hydrolase family protein [Kineococcus aurantiacus]|uniref:Carboxymethylenebutenolidase n=1 Tax=Kineococcus aurantiacus TaxID=37633 RepID=A0A7Y9ASM5_9ACTN|nr:carboxymethylenebutenolidase [Kineococcus aurantiacus]